MEREAGQMDRVRVGAAEPQCPPGCAAVVLLNFFTLITMLLHCSLSLAAGRPARCAMDGGTRPGEGEGSERLIDQAWLPVLTVCQPVIAIPIHSSPTSSICASPCTRPAGQLVGSIGGDESLTTQFMAVADLLKQVRG